MDNYLRTAAILVFLAGCGGSSDDGATMNPVLPQQSCALTGEWQGVIAGRTADVTFATDGTLTIDLDGSPFERASWTFTGAETLDITDGNCGYSEAGLYALSFDADCGRFELSATSDTCTARAGALSGTTYTKQ